MTTDKGEIMHMEKFFDEARCEEYWQVTTRCDKKPTMKLGPVELVQV